MREIVVGITTGCFDMLHQGHLLYLQRCRSMCDRLIVAVDSDELVRSSKGPMRPVIPETQRLEMVNGLKVVSSAFILRDVTRLDAIVRRFNIRLMFKNNPFWDMHCDEKIIYGLEGTDVELVIIPDLPGMPTTTGTIREIIRRHTESALYQADKAPIGKFPNEQSVRDDAEFSAALENLNKDNRWTAWSGTTEIGTDGKGASGDENSSPRADAG